jgi:hypothetical protein
MEIHYGHYRKSSGREALADICAYKLSQTNIPECAYTHARAGASDSVVSQASSAYGDVHGLSPRRERFQGQSHPLDAQSRPAAANAESNSVDLNCQWKSRQALTSTS